MSGVVRGKIILGHGVVGEVDSCCKLEDLAPSPRLAQHSVFYQSPSLDEGLDAAVGHLSQEESTDSRHQGGGGGGWALPMMGRLDLNPTTVHPDCCVALT